MKSTKLEIESRDRHLIPGIKFGLSNLMLISILYLLAFTAAEIVTYYVKDFGGIIFYFAILLSLTINSAVTPDKGQRKLWLALGLVPIIRIVSLAIPISEISEIFWYILITIPVLVGIFVVSRVLKFSLDDIGLNGTRPLPQVIIALGGILFGLIDYFILKPEPLTIQMNLQSILFPGLILIIATGFTEELAFRGVMQRAAGILGSWGWAYIAIIYSILQIGHGSVWHCVFVFAVSLLYGWTVKSTRSIIGVSISHGLFNIVLFLILPHIF